ncbi:hypothetical protein KFK09_003646 [Dendrobium nobile]|uniref:Transmembrane protein n=1 Tax=Dendrobium nobile TaxID=94219 RepID=A0A8T3C1V9_DENNO|nr:hypothetical protein KFK09_003646 [Dendrobium nobile]
MPTLVSIFYHTISRLLLIFNPPPEAATIQSISNPNTTTTTTSLPSPPNNTQSDHPILSFNSPNDLESGNQQSSISIQNIVDTDLLEWKRIGKVAQTVGFGGFGGFVTLFVDTPSSATTRPALYMVYLILVCLGLATSIGLSAYSIIKMGSPTVGLVQKKLIHFTFFFVLLSCFFRLLVALPLVDFGIVIVLILIGLLVIVLYLLLSSRSQRQAPN